jgi:arginase
MKQSRPSIALAGICCDHNSTYLRGPAKAPEKIRGALYSGSANLTSENGVDLLETPLIDYGDHLIDETDDAYLRIENIIQPLLKNGHRPLILGGDHAITFPVIRAMAKHFGSLSILHFDAHPDLYDHYDKNRYAHACPFARIMEEELAQRLVQVGIRTLTAHQTEQADRFGVEIHEMNTLANTPFTPDFDTPLYISFDMDVLDPAFAPGVSHHEPGGMSVREVITIIGNIKCPVVGADIVEYNPHRDINSMTAMAAAKLVKELAAKMSVTES